MSDVVKRHGWLALFCLSCLFCLALVVLDARLFLYFYFTPYQQPLYEFLFPGVLGIAAFFMVTAHHRIRSGKAATVICLLLLILLTLAVSYAASRSYNVWAFNQALPLAVLLCCLIKTLLQRQT